MVDDDVDMVEEVDNDVFPLLQYNHQNEAHFDSTKLVFSFHDIPPLIYYTYVVKVNILTYI